MPNSYVGGCRLSTYSPPKVDIIWGIWGSYSYNIPKTIFDLLEGDFRGSG